MVQNGIFKVMLGICIVNPWVNRNNFSNNRNRMYTLIFREKVIDWLLTDENEDSPLKLEKMEMPLRTCSKQGRGSVEGAITESESIKVQQEVIGSDALSAIKGEGESKETRTKASKFVTLCENCEG